MNEITHKTATALADKGDGILTGYAAAYGNLDRQGDIITKGAFSEYARSGDSLPILWNHDADKPGNVIGSTTKAIEDEHGLLVTARLDLDNPTAAEAYRLLKHGVIRGMSVGMIAKHATRRQDGARIIDSAELLEISLTPTPANPRAEVVNIKSATTAERNTTMADTTNTIDIKGTVTTAPHEETPAPADATAQKDYTPQTKPAPVQTKDHEPDTKPAPVQTKTALADMQRAASAFDATPASGAAFLDLKSLTTIMPRMARDYSTRMGVTKGLVSEGSTAFQVPLINTDPIAADLGAESRPRLVSVIPTITRTAPVYDALQEVTPEDKGGASIVAEGGQKPTTKLSMRKVEQRLRVIATLSEPIDKYALRDIANLDQWIGRRMTDSVIDALENEVVNGDGTGEHLTGLAHIKGVQEQEYDNTPLDTIAAALGKLEQINVNALYLAVNPTDWLRLQRLKNANGDYYMSNVLDAITRKVFGVTIVTAASVAAGTGYLIGSNSINISTDGSLQVEWNPYANFGTNQTIARVEGRYQLDCYSPQRIVRVSLAAPAGK
ncbi:HK97 family phage prohead protease [Bifidobacterium sp. SO4]|uniref:HK97 family phage prohead protease n=1 Tax=Bifidobacterium sp. SO4 TaxID=2809030 RepID=UPI001BDCC3CA|nr:HK97 family phage prohead protease [Bifidobacterium sp. SO4]MBT1171365.1 HK97 family phage prohead protease [Bifidobacterium sp. SO4]